ncbi:MAG: hypothetical protein AAF871_13105 [Pseudomonadota bacterium]
MLTHSLSKPEQASAYLKILDALGAPTNRRPENSLEAASAAIAEAIAFANEFPFSLADVFDLSERLTLYRDEVCGGGEPAVIDINALAIVEGCTREMAHLAARLAGVWNDDGTWRDDGIASTSPILLSFDDWNDHDNHDDD